MGNEDQPGGQSDDEEVVTGALYELTLRPEPPSGRGPLAAAAGSVIWPGLGHVLSGQRRRGRIIGGTVLFLLLVSVWWVLEQRSIERVSWTVQPTWLRAAIIGSILLLAFRLLIGLDAYRRRRTALHGTRRSVWHFAALLLLVALAAAPHMVMIRYASAQLDVLYTVFDATETAAARPTPLLPTTSAPPTTDEVISPAATAPTTAPPTTAAPTTAAPTTVAPTTTVPTWDGDERLTILFLGGDGGFDRSGARTDTIIALSIHVATGDAVAFSIPRNWQKMQYPAGTPAAERFPEGFIGIANELWNLGLRYPHLWPEADNPGAASIKDAVAQLLGVPIHYYAFVDMQGVVEAIDLFGGIDLYVTEWIDDIIKPITPGGPRLDIDVRPGEQHFDGLTALAYMRARTTSSDYHRMSRQRCVVGALVDQVGVRSVLANYTDLTDIISHHLMTDIPLDRLPEMLEVAARLDTSRILTLNFIPPEWKRGNAPIEQVRAAVQVAFDTEIESGIDDLDSACSPPE